jgi:hypothetical protein
LYCSAGALEFAQKELRDFSEQEHYREKLQVGYAFFSYRFLV